MKKVFILFAILFTNVLMSQEEKSASSLKEAVVFVGPAYTNIRNNNISSDKYAKVRGALWFTLGFDYHKVTGRNFGVIFGLNYSGYKNTTEYKGAFRKETTSIDADGDPYYAVVEADYTDKRSMHSLDVPLGLRLSTKNNDFLSFFLDLGLKANLIIDGKLTQKGTMNNKGAYQHPTYSNVYLYIEDEPYYGYKNKTLAAEEEIQVNRLTVGYFVGFGMKAKINDNCFLVINPTYGSTVTDFVKKSEIKDYINVFGDKTAHQKFTMSQFALKVGIGFEI